MNRAIRLLVSDLAKKFAFDEEKAMAYVFETNVLEEDKEVQEEVHEEEKDKKDKKIPLPWTGKVEEHLCRGLIYNYGLFTQCHRTPKNKETLCTLCTKNKTPLGTVEDRCKPDFNGIGKKKVVPYICALNKRKISRKDAEEYARSCGIYLEEHHFQYKKKKKEKRETHILIDPNEEITEEVESPIPFREAKTFLDSYQEAEDDSDSDYEEIVCDVIVFQGTPYLLDRCTHEVYSKEDGNPHVGNYNAEEESIEFLKS